MFYRNILVGVVAFSVLWGEGCSDEEAPEACSLECEFGLKAASNGQAFCECREVETCAPNVPVTYTRPNTADCLTFPSRCDAPSEFTPCCRFKGEIYDPGETFDNDCNVCVCQDDGHYSCTDRACD